MIKFRVKAGLDIGNGYVKGVISARELENSKWITGSVDIPSGVMKMVGKNFVPTPDSEAKMVLADPFNTFDASFDSPIILDNYRRLFGAKALSANGSFEEFDVIGLRSKAEQELSKELVLGLIAAQVLKSYVDIHNALPGEELSADVICALALPITEFMAYRSVYASQFKEGSHLVVVHNFETRCTIKLNFKDVQVVAEGASAQYAINDKGAKLIDFMLKDVRSHGVKLEGITAEDILSVKNTIGVDIGEGTVNFPVFTNGSFNTNASATLEKGYGNVLMGALNAMRQQRFQGGFTSRKQLASYLQEKPSALRISHYNAVMDFVKEQKDGFVKECAEKFGHVFQTVASTTEVVFVYGGGATPVKDLLYDELLDKIQSIIGTREFAVLYLDSGYSRYLNREGLYIAAETIAKRLKWD